MHQKSHILVRENEFWYAFFEVFFPRSRIEIFLGRGRGASKFFQTFSKFCHISRPKGTFFVRIKNIRSLNKPANEICLNKLVYITRFTLVCKTCLEAWQETFGMVRLLNGDFGLGDLWVIEWPSFVRTFKFFKKLVI